MLNPTWLKTLVTLLREGSFQRAAKRLGIAQPTVSLHLKKLEEQVGAQLVERGRAGCRPTARAELLLPYAEQLVMLNERALQALRAEVERVGASSNVGTYLLPPLIRTFLDDGRVGQLELNVASNPDTVSKLLTGEIDIAVTEWWEPVPGFISRPWRYEPLVLIVPAEHELAHAGAISLEHISGFDMLGGEPGSGTGRLLTAYFGKHGVPRVSMHLGNTEAVKEAVKAGLGISIVLASAVAREVQDGSLCAVPLQGLGKQLMVAWRDRGFRRPAMPKFVHHLMESTIGAGRLSQ
ncbi:DNA-binding transcriptional regulator, LysR family [Halopseudomonas xinjiangensis]|uniref:DNA-binding transcriptional regulator, LysR family n=1 Tax=Halopseudomonas xinjiangensis TaxID=487184 RepID=A0A1H1SHV1_9GAMM|nr:LysR family transcriptional regulator [Halopseudomonas xinjiangensis]SDS47398.1 DNA-binding transcriptional regulator, LysR family [Halopseudomonas xinjiangensis]